MEEEIKNKAILTLHHFIEDLNLLIKQFYRNVWGVEKKQIAKAQGFQRQIKES